jgi:hypothetical protein
VLGNCRLAPGTSGEFRIPDKRVESLDVIVQKPFRIPS